MKKLLLSHSSPATSVWNFFIGWSWDSDLTFPAHCLLITLLWGNPGYGYLHPASLSWPGSGCPHQRETGPVKSNLHLSSAHHEGCPCSPEQQCQRGFPSEFLHLTWGLPSTPQPSPSLSWALSLLSSPGPSSYAHTHFPGPFQDCPISIQHALVSALF